MSLDGNVAFNIGVYNVATKEEFQAIFKANKIVVIQLFATWSRDYKIIAPEIDKLSKRFPSVRFVKIDIDDVLPFMQELDISHVHTFLIFKKEENVRRVDSVRGKELLAVIESTVKEDEITIRDESATKEEVGKLYSTNAGDPLAGILSVVKMLIVEATDNTNVENLLVDIESNVKEEIIKLVQSANVEELLTSILSVVNKETVGEVNCARVKEHLAAILVVVKKEVE